ncbi:TetR/AcrR family transcriptional regulator [Mucilaginibacter sabulilitoris]|uniref:TetR/AcrR family transcriptional regulator n=1 Tax=Mucilaginibacter sabulilitoris TaxID=1173583 RepID=A0ABZ0TUW8_9SPHI|nr:TetR/AcrR family transcriptional regulator [Mucilaginibacter sabulilitoris]WPU96900.1 TetR/AcrR family transcriptional regulator [Mucilaginibacter sabulilitoris]
MSNKISTRETIVNKALEMYNAYGVEYVGVRELAKELNTKGGNITYYFPTKNDLLQELAERLTASNSEILQRSKAPGLYGFMEMNKALYFNQYQYRAFFLSLPLWLQQNIAFAKKYREGLITRRKLFTQELETLVNEGYLLSLSAKDMEPVLGALSATGRLWICEATIDGLIDQEEKAVHTYLRRMAGLLQLIATEEGKADLQKFLKTFK